MDTPLGNPPSLSRPRAVVIGPRSARPACARHPRIEAEFRCLTCGTLHCGECARLENFHGTALRVCACQGGCDPIEQAPEPVRGGFPGELVRALAWPLSRRALPMLGVGAVCYAFVDFILSGGALTLIIPVGIVLAMCASGYAVEFGLSIVSSTAAGRDELPYWPDMNNLWDDMIKPWLVTVGLATLCFGPALLAWTSMNGSRAALALAVPGYLLFLLLVTSVAISGGAGLHPRALAEVLADAGTRGPVTAVAVLLLAGVDLVAQALLEVVGVPLVSPILGAFLTLYSIVAGSRMLGLMLRERPAR